MRVKIPCAPNLNSLRREFKFGAQGILKEYVENFYEVLTELHDASIFCQKNHNLFILLFALNIGLSSLNFMI